MDNVTSLRGPVEYEGGELVLNIPLAAGGDQLVASSRGIGVVDGAVLRIILRAWLAEKLGISEGDVVSVDNSDGKFNIQRVS